jgi:hypothetical protein
VVSCWENGSVQHISNTLPDNQHQTDITRNQLNKSPFGELPLSSLLADMESFPLSFCFTQYIYIHEVWQNITAYGFANEELCQKSANPVL